MRPPRIRLRTLLLAVAVVAVALAGGLRWLARPSPAIVSTSGTRAWIRWSDGSLTEVRPGGPVVTNWRDGRYVDAVDWSDGSTSWYLHRRPRPPPHRSD